MSVDFVIDDVVKIIRNASRIFMGDAREHIEEKGKFDFVTQADMRVQELVEKELRALTPSVDFMAEENGEGIYHGDRAIWILDPVDGTTNLICDYHLSAISLALCEYGRITAGIVYNPYLDEMFTAEYGKGAYLNGKPIHVSGSGKMAETVIAVGTSPYTRELSDITFSVIRSVYDRCIDIRRPGTASLDLACVACGRAGGFVEVTLKPWDFAAGMLLVQEAGGIVTDFSGKDLYPGAPTSIIADNGKIHSELKDCVNGALKGKM